MKRIIPTFFRHTMDNQFDNEELPEQPEIPVDEAEGTDDASSEASEPVGDESAASEGEAEVKSNSPCPNCSETGLANGGADLCPSCKGTGKV